MSVKETQSRHFWVRSCRRTLLYVDLLSVDFVTFSLYGHQVYSAVLLFLVQSVSIRRSILRRQSLTATHDITAAWSGLGSAISSLYNQISVTVSAWGVSAVVAYLTCLSILHITTPTLVVPQLFNSTSSLMVNKTHAIPVANANDLWVDHSNSFPWYTTRQYVIVIIFIQVSRALHCLFYRV